MADFARPSISRDQLVLFPSKLDEIVPPGHRVRLLDVILRRLDWSQWEVGYDLTRGQPPIHPRYVASVILYGLLTRIYSTRELENALSIRDDFRWLVVGQTIDHSTIAGFRVRHGEALKALFVQVGLVAREMGYLTLNTLGFDGTRMRANNRRSGTRTPEELQKAKAELAAKFDELQARVAAADATDHEQLGGASSQGLDTELADITRQRQAVDAALAEIARLETEGQKVPTRLPITDPQSRVMPNKEGGFAPNYTPLATVDIDSGLIVSADVIANSDEDKHLMAAVQDVQESFGLERPIAKVLADGMMSTGENLAQCEEAGIDLYSPIKLGCVAGNPAVRTDPSQPVAAADLDRLPTTTTRGKDGSKKTQFHKDAFVYDEVQNSYWCPAGKRLPYAHQTSETENGRERIRYRYKSDPVECATCPLAARCLGTGSKQRQISHEQHESRRITHAKKMATEESKKEYARRRHAGERPFATIKSQFGVRRFLTRGLVKVRNEWLWMASAFNLHRLMSLTLGATGPPVRHESQ
jgi:transposase